MPEDDDSVEKLIAESVELLDSLKEYKKISYKPAYTRRMKNNKDKYQCSRDGCTYRKYQWGLCQKHYYAVLKERRLVRQTRPTDDGYIQVWIQERGWIMKHRLIMEEKLGRKLRKGESIHHINGIRDDNRAENLELWIGPIISGVRASDIKCPQCGTTYSDFNFNDPAISND